MLGEDRLAEDTAQARQVRACPVGVFGEGACRPEEMLSLAVPVEVDEIVAVKAACGVADLKVILETGELVTLDNVRRASWLTLLAGLAFGLGGFLGTNGWPVMLNGAVWAPLVLLFFLRAMRGERTVSSAAWSGAVLGIAFLSGHHQIPIFICRRARRENWCRMLRCASSGRGVPRRSLFNSWWGW